MEDSEGPYEGNGVGAVNFGGGGVSPQPRDSQHVGVDDFGDSKSQVDFQ